MKKMIYSKKMLILLLLLVGLSPNLKRGIITFGFSNYCYSQDVNLGEVEVCGYTEYKTKTVNCWTFTEVFVETVDCATNELISIEDYYTKDDHFEANCHSTDDTCTDTGTGGGGGGGGGGSSKKVIYSKKMTPISTKSERVLTDLMICAGLNSLTINSTQRSAREQAAAMYTNCLNKGIKSQKMLYGSYGDQVIDTYSYYHDKGYSQDNTIAQMTNKINDLGPSNVSKHCGDYSKINVMDISPSSVGNGDKFMDCVKRNSSISNYFSPGSNDPAYHIEIPQ